MGLRKSKPAQVPVQAAPIVPVNGAGKNRVNETDQAILDVKARQRKIRTYREGLVLKETETTEKIKELLKSGQKQRAILILKQKKYIEKEITKADGAQMMLQQTLQAIESAQADVEIMKALKTGDSVLKDLQKQTSMQDWEELYESHQENLQRHDMEVELFGAPLDNDELTNELDAMVAEQVAQELGDLEPAPTIIPKKNEDVLEDQDEEEKEEQVKAKPKRQLVGA